MSNFYCLSCGQLQTDVLTCCKDDGEEVMTPLQMAVEIRRLRVRTDELKRLQEENQKLKRERLEFVTLLEKHRKAEEQREDIQI